MPLLLAIVIGTVQLATFHHARSTAQAAAAACAERARGYDATTTDGERAGRSVLDQVPGITGATVRVTVNAVVARCEVTGTAPLLLAIGPSAVGATVELPRERVG